MEALDTNVGNGQVWRGAFMGRVQSGTLRIFIPQTLRSQSLQLTTVSRTEGRDPHDGYVDIREHETAILLAYGEYWDDWIYDARVLETAPAEGILATVVEEALDGLVNRIEAVENVLVASAERLEDLAMALRGATMNKLSKSAPRSEA